MHKDECRRLKTVYVCVSFSLSHISLSLCMALPKTHTHTHTVTKTTNVEYTKEGAVGCRETNVASGRYYFVNFSHFTSSLVEIAIQNRLPLLERKSKLNTFSSFLKSYNIVSVKEFWSEQLVEIYLGLYSYNMKNRYKSYVLNMNYIKSTSCNKCNP